MPPDPKAKIPQQAQASESSVRQLIANGKFKIALENAKLFHKAQNSAASESLLLDSYRARIQSLLDGNLALEAKSLAEIVLQRFPSARERFKDLEWKASVRGGDLAAMLQPLNDPQLTAERRQTIENLIETEVIDLGALSSCEALPPEHALRKAAGALDRAFRAVTSGKVNEDQIALPEVSHRSPLAPWKLLVRAIAAFYRGEDEACREYLAAVHPGSVPSRLIPALLAMLGAPTSAALKPAEAALRDGAVLSLEQLHKSLVNLESFFAHSDDDDEAPLFKEMRTALRECQRVAPDLLPELKRIAAVRSLASLLDDRRLHSALGGSVRQDAAYFRMYARATELSGDHEDRVEACVLWDEYRRAAVRENLFGGDGVEVAVLYLHMAEVLEKIPRRDLEDYRNYKRADPASDEHYYFFPEHLYARACAIEPRGEAFGRWLRWTSRQSGLSAAENVARQWNHALPLDVQPLLFLMLEAEKRNSFQLALSYLEKAERIDALNAEVRSARVRLLVTGMLHQLRQNKPKAAMDRYKALSALPQSRDGDRPAFIAVLRYFILALDRKEAAAAEARVEVERSIADETAAAILIFGAAGFCKLPPGLAALPRVEDLNGPQREKIPAALARIRALLSDLGIAKFIFPLDYLQEAQRQFPAVRESLDAGQMRWLGELAIHTEMPRLAWAVSGAGLERGGPETAHNLLLRARAMPPALEDRRQVLTAAAAELGRFHRDPEVVAKAVDMDKNPFGRDLTPVTLEQAREVVRKELASSAYPERTMVGPDYSYLFSSPGKEPCDCPSCRSERGETGPFDDEEELDEAKMKHLFDRHAPKDLPPELSQILFQVMREGFLSGDSPDEIMARILGGKKPAKKTKRK